MPAARLSGTKISAELIMEDGSIWNSAKKAYSTRKTSRLQRMNQEKMRRWFTRVTVPTSNATSN